MATFGELGIPFPLFEAPTKETFDYKGIATCEICGRADQHCFSVSQLACYHCFRSGKAISRNQCEFGMISTEWVEEGRVMAFYPGFKTDQFEVITTYEPDEVNWVCIPTEHLNELLRTPDFNTWQGSNWLFCCHQPMIYLGRWLDVLASLAPDHPQAFYESLFKPGSIELEWEPHVFAAENTGPRLYIFRCKCCHRYRANHDND